MGDTLEALRRLQDVELQLATIRRQRNARTRRITNHRRRVRDAEGKLEQHRHRIRERQVKLDALTLDVTDKEALIAKHREALNKAKTNKEYSAILAAMNMEKADAAKLESAILELMDEVQRLQKEAEEIEAERGKFLENANGAEEALRVFDEQHEDQQTKLNAQREACSDNIAPAILSSFTRVAEHHDGEAMAAVAKLHPKRDEYLCEGCNMKITLEVVNALQTRDEIQPCNNCGRLLYLDPSLVKNAKAKS